MKKVLSFLVIFALVMTSLTTLGFCECPFMSKMTKKQASEHQACCAKKGEATCPHMSQNQQPSEKSVQVSSNKPIKTACASDSHSATSDDSVKDQKSHYSSKSPLRLSKQRTYLKNSTLLI